MSNVSCIVSGDTCDKSTIMPRSFIVRTTCSPNGERPPLLAASVPESAQLNVSVWVSVM